MNVVTEGTLDVPFSQFVFTFSISGISCSSTCLNWPSLTPSLTVKEGVGLSITMAYQSEKQQDTKLLTCRRSAAWASA